MVSLLFTTSAARHVHVQTDSVNTFDATPANYYGTEGTSHDIDLEIEPGEWARARATVGALGSGLVSPWSAPVQYLKPPDVQDLVATLTGITAADTDDNRFLQVQVASDRDDIVNPKTNFIDFRDTHWEVSDTDDDLYHPVAPHGFTNVSIRRRGNGTGNLRFDHDDDLTGWVVRLTPTLSYTLGGVHRNGGHRVSMSRAEVVNVLGYSDDVGWIVFTEEIADTAGTDHAITTPVSYGASYRARFVDTADASGAKGDWTPIRLHVRPPQSLYIRSDRIFTDSNDAQSDVWFHSQINYEDYFGDNANAQDDFNFGIGGTERELTGGEVIRARYTTGPRGTGDVSIWAPVLTFEAVTVPIAPMIALPETPTFSVAVSPDDSNLMRVSFSPAVTLLGGVYDVLTIAWSATFAPAGPSATFENSMLERTSRVGTSYTTNGATVDGHWDVATPADVTVNLTVRVDATGNGTNAPVGSVNRSQTFGFDFVAP